MKKLRKLEKILRSEIAEYRGHFPSMNNPRTWSGGYDDGWHAALGNIEKSLNDFMQKVDKPQV